MSSAHSAELCVDLGVACRDCRRLRSLVAAVTYGTVVEADTYGLGASVISCALYATGCRKFFVADLDKALALGHDLPGQFTAFAPNGSVASMADEYRVPASPQF